MIRRGAIWITRSLPGALETARKIEALGGTGFVAPLLSVEAVTPAKPLAEVPAFAVTSSNALIRLEELTRSRSARIYAVGRATADAALRAGFANVSSADGGVEDLARLIAEDPPPEGLVHISGEEVAGDLQARLTTLGVGAERIVVYRTRAATTLPDPAKDSLGRRDLRAVLVHSPKAARVLAQLLRPAFDLADTDLLGLSPGCLEALAPFGWRQAKAAEAPNEEALLRLLQTS